MKAHPRKLFWSRFMKAKPLNVIGSWKLFQWRLYVYKGQANQSTCLMQALGTKTQSLAKPCQPKANQGTRLNKAQPIKIRDSWGPCQSRPCLVWTALFSLDGPWQLSFCQYLNNHPAPKVHSWAFTYQHKFQYLLWKWETDCLVFQFQV